MMKSEELYELFCKNINLITNVICLQYIYNENIKIKSKKNNIQ